MTEPDKGARKHGGLTIEEWEARREWEVRTRALAARALGVDMESTAYRQVANLTDELAETELTRSPEEQHALMRRARATVNYLQGSTPTATPEQAVAHFPSTVHKAASLMRHPSRANLTDPIYTQRPLLWQDGQTGPPVWEADPLLVLAEPVALRWLEETGGTINPHYGDNVTRLGELATEHLEAFQDLWPDMLEAPAPVDAAPLVSTTKVAHNLKAMEGNADVSPGKRKQVQHIANTSVRTYRQDGAPARFTALHRSIGDAITSIAHERLKEAVWGQGILITNHEIVRHMLKLPKHARITPEQVAEVEEVVADSRLISGQIRGTDYAGNRIHLSGPLVHADWVYIQHRNGAETTGWRLHALPLMNQYAGQLKQIRQIDNMLEGERPRYLIRRALTEGIAAQVLVWHGSTFHGTDKPYSLNYETEIAKLGEAKKTGEPLTRDQVRLRQRWIDDTLDHLQGRGFITRWEPYYTGRKKTGVDVFLPEKLPPATLRGFRPLELME